MIRLCCSNLPMLRRLELKRTYWLATTRSVVSMADCWMLNT